MTDAGNAQIASDQVAALSAIVVELAETFELAERAVERVRGECERLGLTARVAGYLDRLVIPSEAAEQLQDELNQVAGELGQEGHGPSDPARAGGIPTPEPQPVPERLSVPCPSCGTHIPVPDRIPEGVERAELDDRTYTCPTCGHRDTFETRDHFLEQDATND